MQKITPCLWFDKQAEEAMKFYISVFKNSAVREVSYYSEAGPLPAGTVLTCTFTLDGQEFMALNGGPEFQFNPAISFVVDCQDQAEVDTMWQKLTEGGEESQCGWLIDKFGVSWQIVPKQLAELMSDPNPVKTTRVMQALFQMKKIDIAALERAYRG